MKKSLQFSALLMNRLGNDLLLMGFGATQSYCGDGGNLSFTLVLFKVTIVCHSFFVSAHYCLIHLTALTQLPSRA
jgi:hypothetical protein